MFIRVDVAAETVTLEEPSDCKKFHVEASGAAKGDVAAVLAAMGAWAADGDDSHVWVRERSVRAAAAPRVGAEWAGEFDGMVGYARSKGWVNDAGDAIRAHIEWT